MVCSLSFSGMRVIARLVFSPTMRPNVRPFGYGCLDHVLNCKRKFGLSEKRETQKDSNEAEAKRILDRVVEESETVGASSMRRVAERMSDHLGAADVDENTWAEVWGTRIGRTLGLIFVIVLIVYLLQTYVFTG